MFPKGTGMEIIMPTPDSLWLALAEAYSQPSKTYQALQEGFRGIKGTAEELEKYGDRKEKARKRQLGQSTLEQVLGGSVPEGLEGFKNASLETLKEAADPIQSIASFNRAMEGDLMFVTEAQSGLTGNMIAPGSRISPRRFMEAVRTFRMDQPKPGDTLKPKLDALENERRAIDQRLRTVDANFGMGIEPEELAYLKNRRSALDNEIRKQAGLPALAAPVTPTAVDPALLESPGVEEKVQVLGPDGKRYKLPRRQLQEAQKQGYRLTQ
jgi:hypothetical protein